MTYTYMTFSSVVYTVPNRTVVLKILKKREKKVRTINRTCVHYTLATVPILANTKAPVVPPGGRV